METPYVSEAVACENTRRLFEAFQHGDLDVEQRGRVRGHLLSCEPCALAFSGSIAAVLQVKPFTLEALLPMPRPPRAVLEAIGVWHPDRGNIWMNLHALATQGVEWAKKEREQVYDAVHEAVRRWALAQMMWQPRTRGIRARSNAAAAPQRDSIAVPIVDSTGHRSGHMLRFEVITPPTVTSDGHFLLILHTAEPDVQGGTLLCTIEADAGMLVTFTGELQRQADNGGWRAIINAGGLPGPDQDVTIPWPQVRLSYQEAEHHAL